MPFLETIFLSRWGGYLVMVLLLGAIAIFLRILFGPKGFFRDPRWDRSNQEIRAEEAAARAARLQAWHGKYDAPPAPEKPQDEQAESDHDDDAGASSERQA